MTDQELQSLRNLGNEAEAAADEIDRLQARCAALEEALRECLQVLGPSAPACAGCSAEIGIALFNIKAVLLIPPDAPAEGAKE